MNLDTLCKIQYGMFIVSSKKGESINGQIANTVFQVTPEPPTIAISINKKNLTHEYIDASNTFSVSILSKNAPLKFIGLFGFRSGRDVDKFKDVNYTIGKTGAPIVADHTIGFIEADVIGRMDVDTHTLFIGKVVEAETTSDEEPMTYTYYHESKSGLTPEKAPTYIKGSKTASPRKEKE